MIAVLVCLVLCCGAACAHVAERQLRLYQARRAARRLIELQALKQSVACDIGQALPGTVDRLVREALIQIAAESQAESQAPTPIRTPRV